MSDPINPDHYKVNGLECIDVIEKLKLPFHLANALKYIWRAGRKNSAIEDIKKARWYLDRYINAHVPVLNVDDLSKELARLNIVPMNISETIKPEYTLVYDYSGEAKALYFADKPDALFTLDRLNSGATVFNDYFFAAKAFPNAWAVVEVK